MNMKNYFRLYEECFFICEDEESAAIYNLITGDVLSTFTIPQTNIIKLFENNVGINEISDKLSMSELDIRLFLDDLVKNELGFYIESPLFVEKLISDDSWKEHSCIKFPPEIKGAYILLEDQCYLDCTFCNGQYFRGKSCVGCGKNFDSIIHSDLTATRTSKEEYKFVLDNLKQLGATDIIFTGGDLLLDFDNNMDIIKYASDLSFENICVYIGGNRKIEKSIVNQLKGLNAHIYLQVEILEEYSIKESQLLLSNLTGLKYVPTLIFKADASFELYEKTIDLCNEKYAPEKILIDIAFTKEELNKHEIRQQLHQFRKTSIHDFSLSREKSRCMHGYITITTKGTIAVCPRLQKESYLGEIKDFNECLKEEKINRYWQMTKDKIKSCSTCGFKYVCDDCRYIEYSLSKENDLLSMNTCPNLGGIQ